MGDNISEVIMKVVAFTGYRPEKLNFTEDPNDLKYQKFRKIQMKVIKRLLELGYKTFISGLARGFDTWTAEDICILKQERKDIRLICAIPYPEQDEKWSNIDKCRRQKIMAVADEAVVVSEKYTEACFFERNRFMVDNADVVVCCYDGKPGGTSNAVNYALKKDKVVIQINPTTMVVSIISKRKPTPIG